MVTLLCQQQMDSIPLGCLIIRRVKFRFKSYFFLCEFTPGILFPGVKRYLYRAYPAGPPLLRRLLAILAIQTHPVPDIRHRREPA